MQMSGKKGAPSLPVSLFSASPSLCIFTALILKQVLQWACSAGSSCLIVCYFFNTYIMYFIKICCQSPACSTSSHHSGFFFFFNFIYLFLLASSSVSGLSFFHCQEFNYPGCCFMMLSWHPVTDSLSHLLACHDSSIGTVVSSTCTGSIRHYWAHTNPQVFS